MWLVKERYSLGGMGALEGEVDLKGVGEECDWRLEGVGEPGQGGWVE